MAHGAYTITTKTYTWPNRKLKEVKETNGYFLEFNDLWSPVVIQMGRASDYKNFKAFCDSVRGKKFAYENGKLTYVSEAGDMYEYWARSTLLPHINTIPINLNPEKTYDSPFLAMKHGSTVATIMRPDQKALVLDFSSIKN